MDKQVKAEIIAKYATHEGDTGSPDVANQSLDRTS